MLSKYYFVICIFLILICGLLGVRYNPIYSGADEGAHFDYINHIIDYKQLPTTDMHIDESKLEIPQASPNTIPRHLQHEAVQPPLYYFIAAVIGGLFSDIFTRLMVLRAFGVLLLVISFYICYSIYKILAKEKIIPQNDLLFLLVSLLFITSPYFLRIMVPLNNEHLLLVLVSGLLFLLAKYYLQESLSLRKVIILALFTGAIILTKFTAAYVFGLVVLLLLLRKKYTYIALYGAIVFMILSPWFYFNFTHYQAFTGIKNHISIVAPIVNPGGIVYSILDIIKGLPGFFTQMWYWQSGSLIIRIFYIVNTTFMILSIIFAAFSSLKKPILFLFTISLAGNFFMLMYATLTTPIFSIHGRYMYMNYISFVILMYSFITMFNNKKWQTLIGWVLIFSILLFNISHFRSLVPFINNVF